MLVDLEYLFLCLTLHLTHSLWSLVRCMLSWTLKEIIYSISMCTHLQAYNPDYMYLLHTIHQIKGKLCCSRKHPYLPWKDFFSLSLPLHHSGISGWASFKELYFWIPLPLEFKGKTECAICIFVKHYIYKLSW